MLFHVYLSSFKLCQFFSSGVKVQFFSSLVRLYFELPQLSAFSTLLLYHCLMWFCVEAITFERAPSNQYLRRHAAGFIQCVVSGQPQPTVSWRFRGSRIITGL